MMKLAVSVVDFDVSSKGFAELHLGTGEAEAFWLGRDLETATVPLHHVVIADDALVDEAADAAEIFGGQLRHVRLQLAARGTSMREQLGVSDAAREMAFRRLYGI